MTLAEKILARHVVRDAASDAVGVPAVAPGDAGFVRADWRFSHEYVTPMAANAFERELGAEARIADRGSVLLFRDHLALLAEVMPQERRERGLLALAEGLAARQEEFARAQGVTLHGAGDGICHALVLERYARPGQVVVGSDSHTTHAGALGALAFGIGTSEVACAWLSRDVRVKVPETIRVELSGAPPAGVAAKDVMLALLAHPYVKGGGAIGKVLEYAGEAVDAMSVDERATLTNMAAEAGAFAGIVAPDGTTARFLAERRGMPLDEARRLCEGLAADPGAVYASVLTFDVSALAPLVALPGDPGNGVAIADLAAPVSIDIAYGGSCTAGKREDMEMLAAVLADGLARGRRVAPGVRFYVQFGSRDVREWCREKGYLDVFQRAGAIAIEPGCGACIAAGPGISTRADEVTVSAINRNFPGRSGPGSVYLASPYVVAASALAGRITAWVPGG
jgi:3-isopropylmalate/(R)-2-methylmalate dehydratase large subunit